MYQQQPSKLIITARLTDFDRDVGVLTTDSVYGNSGIFVCCQLTQ